MKPTQSEQILDYMRRFGSITAKQAESHIGCMRLASRICDLKEMGYAINREMITVKTRSGKTRVARYSLNG